MTLGPEATLILEENSRLRNTFLLVGTNMTILLHCTLQKRTSLPTKDKPKVLLKEDNLSTKDKRAGPEGVLIKRFPLTSNLKTARGHVRSKHILSRAHVIASIPFPQVQQGQACGRGHDDTPP